MMISRRRFLTAAGALLTPSAWAALTPGTVKTVSIIHTTDLHGHILPAKTYEGLTNVGGLARCATVIKKWRAESPLHLTLDIGDLYQGTEAGLRTQGGVMVKLLNALHYDAWVLGNHDFDWGRDVVESAIAQAQMPVLASNVTFSGKAPGTHEKGSPFARVAPFLLREIGGFKIGIIGAVTPGLSSWLAPQILREIEARDPLGPVRAAAAELKSQGAQAIIIAGHMGFRGPAFLRDDFANRVSELTKDVPDIDAFLGGHTHRDVPTARANRVPYSQANYYGIHLGRMDLTFHAETGQLLDVRPFTVLMDGRYELDPAVLSLAKNDLDLSEAELKKPVGAVRERLSAAATPGAPSQQEQLIGRAIMEALAARQVRVAGVFHGSFSDEDIAPGPKTIADMWGLMPYENFTVTAALMREEIIAILNEAFANGRNSRNLLGFTVRLQAAQKNPAVAEVLDASGQPLAPGQRHVIAFNSYDAQSGGQRLLRLKEILGSPEARTTFHPVETRQAVIDFFLRHREIDAKTLAH